MRHVSRTHRVATDWLFDRIKTNLRHGDLETEMDGMKGDLTETETESNEVLCRQQHGWSCPQPHELSVFCSCEHSDKGFSSSRNEEIPMGREGLRPSWDSVVFSNNGITVWDHGL